MDTTDKNTMIPGKMTRPEVINKLFQDYDYKGFAHELTKIVMTTSITKRKQIMIEIKLKELCSQIDMISLDFLNEKVPLRDVYNAFHTLYNEESNILNEYT